MLEKTPLGQAATNLNDELMESTCCCSCFGTQVWCGQIFLFLEISCDVLLGKIP